MAILPLVYLDRIAERYREHPWLIQMLLLKKGFDFAFMGQMLAQSGHQTDFICYKNCSYHRVSKHFCSGSVEAMN